ncbi:hypothetical protein NECAME_05929 [Necator americanus]|uniref:AMP-binding enzyme n=1 Tax=Necator americanus TaxID=51031 RepID=W2TWR7_NECAM|nr:hypothetical protein NECAME_05929 [Necator americanus]ETN86525.1 hypothetical protein NECAME_05929 [Necator americanus]
MDSGGGSSHRFMFPTLALSKTGRGGPLRRTSCSDNHKDYLAALRSRKVAHLREKRSREVRRYLWGSLGFDLCELEGVLKNCRWKQACCAGANINEESFETIRKALKKRRVSNLIPQYIHEDIAPRPTLQDYDLPSINEYSSSSNSSDEEDTSATATLRIGYNGRINVQDLPLRRLLEQNWRPSSQPLQEYYKDYDAELEGKLLSRSNKVAFMLLNKTIAIGKDNTKAPMCKPGDRVALIYANTEPLAFLAAFYGCILAGVVPVPVEVPLTKRDAGIQQLGFLLGSCGVKVALTSETCYKGLPKGTASSTSSLPKTTPSGSSSLTGSSQEIVDLKSWPRLYWVITEHLAKPSKDWTAPPRVADESIAYIEYSCDREGAVKGVCVSRQSMLAHCRAITAAMEYKQGDTMICVLDFKREVGLWHAVLAAVFNGMRVVFVPYSLMKINPASWMLMATKLQASVALVKSRDLHWGLLATRDHKDVNLSSLKSLLVADGANPWSLSSCDQFATTFAAHGLKPEAMCPCSGSSETGTISLRKRTASGTGSSGRGILSMAALSHSVVRVDKENSLTSLTLQDAGQVIPGGSVVVVKQTGPSRLCRADELGEICLCANSTGHAYWGLEGVSTATFKNLLEILRSRASSSPDHRLFTLVTSKNPEHDTATCASLLKRAERIGAFLVERGRLNVGDHVALIFPPGIDFIAAFYGCLVAGVVPVCIRAPLASSLQTTLPSVRMIVDVSKAVAIVSNSSVCKLLKSKEAAHRVDSKAWPMILDIEDSPASWKRKTSSEPSEPLPSDACYLDFSVSTTGQLLLPGVKVVIANPETRGQCADSHLGEIWVSSPHNAMGYFTVYGEETSLHTDHFNARLAFGDTMTRFARTGYLGFLRQTQAITEDGELHDAVFVVGALEETLMLRGMRYHPVDIESTVTRCHKYLGDCAVFTWSHLIVVVAECTGAENDALDLVPAVTSSVLEEHYLIVGVVVVVDPNTIPLNSRGEKQRHLLRENFLHDQLDPIYVAYNM